MEKVKIALVNIKLEKGVFEMPDNHKPKLDDRSDNVDKLQDMVEDTIQNLEASHDTMSYASGEAKAQIQEKNKRRKEAIEGMRQEIKDEANHDEMN